MFTKCHVVSGQRTIIDKSHHRHMQPIQSPLNNNDKTEVALDELNLSYNVRLLPNLSTHNQQLID